MDDFSYAENSPSTQVVEEPNIVAKLKQEVEGLNVSLREEKHKRFLTAARKRDPFKDHDLSKLAEELEVSKKRVEQLENEKRQKSQYSIHMPETTSEPSTKLPQILYKELCKVVGREIPPQCDMDDAVREFTQLGVAKDHSRPQITIGSLQAMSVRNRPTNALGSRQMQKASTSAVGTDPAKPSNERFSVITSIQSLQEDLTKLERELKSMRDEGPKTTAMPEKLKSSVGLERRGLEVPVALGEVIHPVASTAAAEGGRRDPEMPTVLGDVIAPVTTTAFPEEGRSDAKISVAFGDIIDLVATAAAPEEGRRDTEMSIDLEEAIDPVATTAASENENRETASMPESESKEGKSILVEIFTFWDFPDEFKADVEEGTFWLLDADGDIIPISEIDSNFLLGVWNTFQRAPGGTRNVKVGHCISEKKEVALETNVKDEVMFVACHGCVTNGKKCIVRVPLGFIVMLDSLTEEERDAFRLGVSQAGQFPKVQATDSMNTLNSDFSSDEWLE